MPRLPKPLPVFNDATPTVHGDGEGLVVFLAPVNDPWIQDFLGEEKVIEETDRLPGCRVTQGARYRGPQGGFTQGRRYLWTTDGRNVLGALNVTLNLAPGRRKPSAVVSNIFVHPDHRRAGVASAMIRRAQQDFPALAVDSTLSQAGAALFLGQVPTPAPTPDTPVMPVATVGAEGLDALLNEAVAEPSPVRRARRRP